MKKRKIEFICSEERIKEEFSKYGKFIEFTNKEFQVPYYDVPTFEGVELPEGFPIPKTFFHEVYESATEYLSRFPNCCDAHKALVGKKWFKKSDYAELPIKAASQLYYTAMYIEELKNRAEIINDVTNYIETNILSFGQLPDGYGSPVGSFYYTKGIRNWLKGYSDIPAKLKKQIIKYLDNRNIKSNTPSPDLNLLYDTYQKWLSVFPFDIEYFNIQREHFRKVLPLFTGKMEYNRFIGAIGGTPHTQEGLLEFLNKVTEQLLEKVNSWELVKQGLISDMAKHQFDLINEAHRIKQTILLKTFTDAEKQYVQLLNSWLQNEKEYFSEITPHLKTNIEKTVSKTESIKAELMKHGFCELPLVKKLNQSQQSELFKLIGINKLPYQIAMFDYLGYLDLLMKEFHNSQYQVLGHLTKVLGLASSNIRPIKANINVLNPKSNENRSRYTAHIHKETVKKDYQNIK